MCGRKTGSKYVSSTVKFRVRKKKAVFQKQANFKVTS